MHDRPATAPAPASAPGTAGLLHVSEAELRLHLGDAALRRSPVLAVLDGGQPRFGDAALQVVHRDPRQFADGYLRELSTRAIGLRSAPHLTPADLLYLHLRDFTAGTAAQHAFVVSPGFSPEALALLLGVAHRAELRPAALVDAAALAGSIATHAGEHALYVEPGVRGMTLTVIDHDGDHVLRGSVHTVPGLGLRAARDLWLRWVREQSIARWRIDPLLDPTRASALLSHWPQASAVLERGDGGSIDFDGGHRLDYAADDVLARLQDAARDFVDAVLAQLPDDGVVVLDAMTAELPGLASRLARYRDTRVLEASAFPRAFTQLSGRVDLRVSDDGAAHLLRIPRMHAREHWRATDRPRTEPLALLLVLGQRALALSPGSTWRITMDGGRTEVQAKDARSAAAGSSDAALVRTARLEVHADHAVLESAASLGLRVNGRTVSGRTVLRPGDDVRMADGSSLRLVALDREASGTHGI